jgi:hypothetical protein
LTHRCEGGTVQITDGTPGVLPVCPSVRPSFDLLPTVSQPVCTLACQPKPIVLGLDRNATFNRARSNEMEIQRSVENSFYGVLTTDIGCTNQQPSRSARSHYSADKGGAVSCFSALYFASVRPIVLHCCTQRSEPKRKVTVFGRRAAAAAAAYLLI